MIFDALGRLALGQVDQNFAVDTNFLIGVRASSSVGSIQPAVSNLPNGVGASGSVGGIAANAGPDLNGVLATGSAGLILTPDMDVVPGVSGTGSAGRMSTALRVTSINGVQGIGSAGVVMTQSSTKIITGVGAVGSVGLIDTFGLSANLIGVRATGSANKITVNISGGGGGKKPKTGLEPIAKRPPAPPIEIKLPTYVLPNFAPKAQPSLPPSVRTPFERSPGIVPLDLMGMREQIQAAQDEADMKAVLAFLDDLD